MIKRERKEKAEAAKEKLNKGNLKLHATYKWSWLTNKLKLIKYNTQSYLWVLGFGVFGVLWGGA